jgi:hypothetical protein
MNLKQQNNEIYSEIQNSNYNNNNLNLVNKMIKKRENIEKTKKYFFLYFFFILNIYLLKVNCKI